MLPTRKGDAVQRLGTVDILVINAGIAYNAMAHMVTEEDWDRAMDVKLKSTDKL